MMSLTSEIKNKKAELLEVETRMVAVRDYDLRGWMEKHRLAKGNKRASTNMLVQRVQEIYCATWQLQLTICCVLAKKIDLSVLNAYRKRYVR